MSPNLDNDFLPVAVILIPLLIVNIITFRNGHDWGDDFSQYIYQAKSLVDGTTDRLLEVSRYRYDHSENKRIGPVLYPWGFPIILSPVYALFGLDLFPMKAFTNLFFLSSLGLIFLLFRNRLGRFENYLVLIILGINPSFFAFKDNILSDIPFMFSCLLSIFFMQRFIIERKPFLNEGTSHALIGISIFISCAIRDSGIVLLPTLFMIQLIESLCTSKDRHALSLPGIDAVIPYGVFAILTMGIRALLPSASSESYLEQLSMVRTETVAANIRYYMILPSVFFTGSIPAPLDLAGRFLFLLSIPLVLMGLTRNLRENYHFAVFSALTLLLYILWPGNQGLRFIFPVIPFYLFFMFTGLGRVRPTIRIPVLKRSTALPLTAVFGSAVIVLFGLTVSSQVYSTFTSSGQDVLEGPYTKDSIELFSYISDNTKSSDVVIFSKPRAMALYTQRTSIRLTNIEGILASPARYIACRKNEPLARELENCGVSMSKKFENRGFIVYRKQELRASAHARTEGR